MPAPTKEWLAEQYHSGRMNIPDAHHDLLSDNEHEALTNAFNSLATEVSGEKRVQRASLVSHLQAQLPRGPPSFADHVYRILAYHSTAPFYHAPSTPLPESLSLLDVQRALVWLLPDIHLGMSVTGNMGRMRTAADGRRLLFQSLATRSVLITDDHDKEAARRRYAHRNAHDANHVKKQYGRSDEETNEMLADWCKSNRDDDGDEMFHDLLDVLHKNVPENYPYGTGRDDLRPLAKELKNEVKLHELAIPQPVMVDLVRSLLALQFEHEELTPAYMSALDEPAASVMHTFICQDDELADAYPTGQENVAWPAFDYGLQQLPCLFDPVYRVLIKILLNDNIKSAEVEDLYGMPPELQAIEKPDGEPYVLSPALVALMPAIIPLTVDWEFCHTVLRWRRSSGPHETRASFPDADAIWAHIRAQPLDKNEGPPPSKILAFTGHDQVSDERFAGGVMFAADYGYDRNGEHGLIYGLHVFRLAPFVRYQKLQGQEWRRGSDRELAFGDTGLGSGFRVKLDKLVAEIELPAFGKSQTIELEGLEIWDDDGRP